MAAQTTNPYGGHDNDFVDQDLEKLTCIICTKVVRDPHLTACCGLNVCASCLTQWFVKTKKESCPHCRAEGRDFQHIPDKKAKREVNDLQVRCSNKIKGCAWVGKLVDLNKHLDSEDGCECVEVECPNKCKRNGYWSKNCRLQRKHLSRHLREECPRRPSTCEYCGHKDEYGSIIRHIDFNCPEKRLKCHNKCDARPIKRKDLAAHREVCPLQSVSCPFKNAGCSVEIVRRDLDNHIAANTQQHLLQTFEKMEKLQKETNCKMKAMQTEIDFLQQTELSEESVKLSLACMSTHLHPGRKERVFRMTDLSNYKKNGEVWQSPSFYSPCPGTHLRLDVNPSGTGSGKGSHVSLSIVFFKEEGVTSQGRYLRKLYEVIIKLYGQVPPSPRRSASIATPAKIDTSKEWVSNFFNTELSRKEESLKICANEQFVALSDLERYSLNDSLVFICVCHHYLVDVINIFFL